jgi:hypothetical protein
MPHKWRGLKWRLVPRTQRKELTAGDDRTIAARSRIADLLYWTLIVVGFAASILVFGMCTVSTPSFASAVIPFLFTYSGSAKLREKLP